MDNIDNHINVNFYYLSNETNPGFYNRFGVMGKNILGNGKKLNLDIQLIILFTK